MVSFSCDKCGNGFRKNQVESHMWQCGSRIVSCVDCSKEFNKDDFKLHIKCITESQKYESKSSYVQKANKGEVKQNAWIENVRSAVETFRGSQRAKDLLEKLTEFPNIPRKKTKFYNFMYNSFRSYGVHDGLLGEIWTVIESFDKKPAVAPKPNVQKDNEDESINKRKLEENECEEIKEVSNKKSKSEKIENEKDSCKEFDWIESAKLVCSKNEEKTLKFKKLFKKVLKSYKKSEENSEIDSDKLREKLIKKLRKKSSIFELSADDEIDNIRVKCIV